MGNCGNKTSQGIKAENSKKLVLCHERISRTFATQVDIANVEDSLASCK